MKIQTEQKINSLKSGWYVWLFPLIAIAISIWLFKDYLGKRGPTIQIMFEDGSSIQPEKTKVRFRGVAVGQVKKVSISEDTKQVIAEVALQKEAEDFAVEGSKFWVVMPKVGFQGVTGLETLFEGTYIAVQPGKPEAEPKYEFKGRIGGEASEAVEDTATYFLETATVNSVTEGNPVTFRGMTVGSVTKVILSKSAQTILLQINIQNKYSKLIRTNTVFWKKVAIQANLGLFNSEVKINSLESLLRGGVEFFTPDAVGEVAKVHTHFPLVSAPPKGWEKWNPKIDF